MQLCHLEIVYYLFWDFFKVCYDYFYANDVICNGLLSVDYYWNGSYQNEAKFFDLLMFAFERVYVSVSVSCS